MQDKEIPVKIINADGTEIPHHKNEHFKIQPRLISGYFQSIRKYSLWFMMSLFFSFCWIRINDQPLVLFDIITQKFHIFGFVFWPQDFFLLAILLIIAAFGLFFVTTLFGRVWCGYTCPQTAWTFVYIWLEEKIEGSRNQRIKLDKAPWTFEKTSKRLLKHASWLSFAFITGFTFIAYFYPARELAQELFTLSFSSIHLPLWITFFTLATYINAGFMRESVCTHICPYARFQSVMFNEDTLIVAYDEKRGEPRGKQQKDPVKQAQQGSCIDCKLCVQVCPTGIDIREGLQYQCIGCALCVDACDSIMDKIEEPKGLIRYATETELQKGTAKHKINGRSIGYGGVLLIAIVGFAYNLYTLPLLEFHVLRDRGSMFQTLRNGEIKNNYTLKIANKSLYEQHFQLSLAGVKGRVRGTNNLIANAGEVLDLDFAVFVPKDTLKHSSTDIQFTIHSDGEQPLKAHFDSKFMGPRKKH